MQPCLCSVIHIIHVLCYVRRSFAPLIRIGRFHGYRGKKTPAQLAMRAHRKRARRAAMNDAEVSMERAKQVKHEANSRARARGIQVPYAKPHASGSGGRIRQKKVQHVRSDGAWHAGTVQRGERGAAGVAM